MGENFMLASLSKYFNVVLHSDIHESGFFFFNVGMIADTTEQLSSMSNDKDRHSFCCKFHYNFDYILFVALHVALLKVILNLMHTSSVQGREVYFGILVKHKLTNKKLCLASTEMLINSLLSTFVSLVNMDL